MEEGYAIRVRDIGKRYKLYSSNKDRVLDSLGLTRKKRYKEHHALSHVSFDVKKGETVGIIGTNGAGKSTMLKIITGVLSPSSGELEIDGRISALLELGAGFHSEYTGLENIYLNGTMMGYSREEVEVRLQSILDFADIGDFIHQPVKKYSSGMFVRLAFALAINIDPEILVVDEALSVGDVFFQNRCYRKFDEFKREGKTILFVSHDLSSVSKYCDRVILLNKGSKLSEGSPRDMIDLYKRMLSGSDEEKRLIEAYFADRRGEGSLEELDLYLADRMDRASVRDSAAPSGRSAGGEGVWKEKFRINPRLSEYGNKEAEIIDFAVVDQYGRFSSSIEKGSRFQIRTKVFFHEDIEEPIFTFTFKNIRGVDITGTNTMFEKQTVPLAKKGETYVVTYEQEMSLQGGDYLLSMSCTGFVKGVLVAFHRCYDLLDITVISDKNTAGFYDMNSTTRVEKLQEP